MFNILNYSYGFINLFNYVFSFVRIQGLCCATSPTGSPVEIGRAGSTSGVGASLKGSLVLEEIPPKPRRVPIRFRVKYLHALPRNRHQAPQ